MWSCWIEDWWFILTKKKKKEKRRKKEKSGDYRGFLLILSCVCVWDSFCLKAMWCFDLLSLCCCATLCDTLRPCRRRLVKLSVDNLEPFTELLCGVHLPKVCKSDWWHCCLWRIFIYVSVWKSFSDVGGVLERKWFFKFDFSLSWQWGVDVLYK
jgi:hypothetical protein